MYKDKPCLTLFFGGNKSLAGSNGRRVVRQATENEQDDEMTIEEVKSRVVYKTETTQSLNKTTPK